MISYWDIVGDGWSRIILLQIKKRFCSPFATIFANILFNKMALTWLVDGFNQKIMLTGQSLITLMGY